ncbi:MULTISPECIES: hypothetical protein [unclassified Methylobacterium]|uniref:hypothetical protein n=1 Tax=unclassified Methylobacterium TaxID=2615210 RepID=UPI0006F5335F|nr:MULTISPECIES: hypothetical protein [unclassified Methylobacterium]KQP87240.1 hypothetical protein ASF60_21235 [Methylobacterium sp. Leaf113]KQP88021.1 hypothetical protein ASF57_07270 [Methylobacterium sp. Leaf117]MCK2055592.1 hypothetical protein [Methylobacterium sp. 37f]
MAARCVFARGQRRTGFRPLVFAACLILPGISHSALSDHRRRHALEGRWIGDDYTLTIDEDAVQANRNPTRPFEWDALHILNTTENMIVFELGGDRFVGLLEGERMTLSQIGRPGYHVLTRQR